MKDVCLNNDKIRSKIQNVCIYYMILIQHMPFLSDKIEQQIWNNIYYKSLCIDAIS